MMVGAPAERWNGGGMIAVVDVRSENAMALSGTQCPDCRRRVRAALEQTITGRLVCPDCARALASGATVGAITGNVGSGFGVWATMMRRVRRSSPGRE
jgi:hypothetical protein